MKQLLFLTLTVGFCHSQAAKPAQILGWDADHIQSANEVLASETNISAAERSWLEQWLAKQYKDDPNPSKRAAETRVQLIDLNGDGVPEIVAQATGDILCSPTGNCQFWVFQKIPSGYRLILEKGAIQGFTIQPNRTNGYSDLVLNMHGSATEQELHLYQFKRDRYQRIACYDANWTFLDMHDEVKELKEPRVTPCQ